VTVSGSGCGPGLTHSASDYVSVSSTTLPLGVQVPVNGNGSWSTTFTVPPGTLPLPAAIAALCFTNGFPSLTTIYTPGTFTVTAAAPPPPPTAPPPATTPTTPGNTASPANPTTPTTKSTKPGNKGNQPGADSAGGTGSTSGAGRSGSGSGARRSGGGSGDEEFATLAGTVENGGSGGKSGVAAGLRSPELASDSNDAGGGLGWWWLLVLVLLAAAVGGAWAWWRSRRAPGAAPEPVPVHDEPTGVAAPDDRGLDDHPFDDSFDDGDLGGVGGEELEENELEVVGLYDEPASSP
jgi:hypothetical protein